MNVREFVLKFVTGNGNIKVIKDMKTIFDGNMESLLYDANKEILNYVVSGVRAKDNYMIIECWR